MADDVSKMVLTFWAKAEEAQDLLIKRAPRAFPVRRDEASLRKRREAGDPNVVCCRYEDGEVSYKLRFTDDQRRELIDAYHEAHPGPRGQHCEAESFVATLEVWADAALDSDAIEPPDQKARKRSIDSFVRACERLDVALADMDSAALGYLYAHAVDRLAAAGVAVSPADDRMASMLEHPIRAQVEAGELRQNFRIVVGAIVEAARSAQAELPKYDRELWDFRWQTARALERSILWDGLDFDTSETGFPAKCLRAVFDLAGLEVEKVAYWLRKRADDPDSEANFFARLRNKSGGENLPPD